MRNIVKALAEIRHHRKGEQPSSRLLTPWLQRAPTLEQYRHRYSPPCKPDDSLGWDEWDEWHPLKCFPPKGV